MLFFTYPYDLSGEVKQKMRELLERETGETCLILDMGCTGVYYAPDRPDRLKGMYESEQSPQSSL